MPSQVRRIIVILAYLFACFVLFTAGMAATVPAGLVSQRCIDGRPCSGPELIVLSILWLVWAGLSISSVVLGWRGGLWGARAQR
jgi:hypothetical protein